MKRLIIFAAFVFAATACSEAPAEPLDAIVFLRCNGFTSYDTSSETSVEVKHYKIDKSAKTILAYFDEGIDQPIEAEITDRNIRAYHEADKSDVKSVSNISFDMYSATVNHDVYNEHQGSRLFTIQVKFSGQCERVDGPPTRQF